MSDTQRTIYGVWIGNDERGDDAYALSGPPLANGETARIVRLEAAEAAALLQSCHRSAVLAWMLAEFHLGDGDELGEIARELLGELRARADAEELERAVESFRTASDERDADPKS